MGERQAKWCVACFVKQHTTGEDLDKAIQRAVAFVGQMPKEYRYRPNSLGCGMMGWVIASQRDLLNAPFVVLDEFLSADRAVRNSLNPFLAG